MTEHAVHLLSGAYAVGALDDIERAHFEAHLETCADCRAEVAGLLEVTALLAETSATPPPPQVREAVLAGISTVRPIPPEVSRTAGRRAAAPESSRRRWLPALVAAAAAVAAVGAGVVVYDQVTGDDTSQQLTAAERVLAAADAERVEHTIGGATATVVVSRSQGRAVLVTEDMPAAPDGKVYELWLQTPDDDMVPAGLMPPGEDQTFLLKGDATEAVGVGITLEPEGGSKEPTLPAVAVIGLA